MTTRTITVEALAAAMLDFYWKYPDQADRDENRKDAAAIFAALPAEPAGAGLREALAARFVATYWRDQYLAEHAKGEHGYWAIGTHPLACVIGALDGETNPRELGLPESQDEAFRAALAATPEEA